MNTAIRNEDSPGYNVQQDGDDKLIADAIKALRKRLHCRGAALTSPHEVRDLIRLSIAGCINEVFCVMFLRTDHSLIAQEELFQGTIDGASVYPRVIAQRALTLNAAAVILYHNHPSGNAEPSQADKALTSRICDALKLIDIRVLDHLIVGGDVDMQIESFAERGLI